MMKQITIIWRPKPGLCMRNMINPARSTRYWSEKGPPTRKILGEQTVCYEGRVHCVCAWLYHHFGGLRFLKGEYFCCILRYANTTTFVRCQQPETVSGRHEREPSAEAQVVGPRGPLCGCPRTLLNLCLHTGTALRGLKVRTVQPIRVEQWTPHTLHSALGSEHACDSSGCSMQAI